VINVPPRGAGKKMIEQIQQTSESAGISLFESAFRIGNIGVRNFLSSFDPSLHNQMPSGFLADLLAKIGYEEYLKKEDPLTADDRMENITEFLAYLRDNESQPEFDLASFIGGLPLQTPEEKGTEAVTLLTIHSAKGLEFNVLFVVGMEEGLFPHVKSMELAENMEEERRLFYVAITRAGEKLSLSWAQRRGMFGSSMSNRPSRFLDEIPSWFKTSKISERFGAVAEPASLHRRNSDASGPIDSPFRVGSVVQHEKLGRGTILNVEGAPNDWKLTIRFPDGVKKIMSRYAHLTIE
jgi:DNA helicase-2/ATP-dependent DNA helicase PcrA